jgi:hypothetical protein
MADWREDGIGGWSWWNREECADDEIAVFFSRRDAGTAPATTAGCGRFGVVRKFGFAGAGVEFGKGSEG